jgi:hypothetical protein
MIERTSWGRLLDLEEAERPAADKDRRDWQWPDW